MRETTAGLRLARVLVVCASILAGCGPGADPVDPPAAPPGAVSGLSEPQEKRRPRPAPSPVEPVPTPVPVEAPTVERLLEAGSPWTTPVVPPADGTAPALGLVAAGFDSWVRSDGWSVPFHLATAADPLQTLLYNPDAWSRVASGEWRRSGNGAAVEAAIRATSRSVFPYRGNVYSSTSTTSWQLPADFNGLHGIPPATLRFHLGAAMVPAPGWDGHLAVMQPDGRVLETYAAIRLSDGTLVALSYSVTHPRHKGDGWENGQTASMLPVYLGLLDAASLEAGRIGHALAVTVPARLLAPTAAYPAFAFDRSALTEHPPYAGTLPMGARLVLPVDADPPSLGLATPEGLVIADAARRHGFIVVDRGGEGLSVRVRRNPARPNPRLTEWDPLLQDDLNRIVGRLVVLR